MENLFTNICIGVVVIFLVTIMTNGVCQLIANKGSK